ncbi:MAG: mannitol dehydrogenase family protein [Phyllobacteriaceae bacterium]|jgi:mannitol 2-dehydrogenase|nr:mannitol dehydrogenase family protein [Phyllobacteriaceae bacterium]
MTKLSLVTVRGLRADVPTPRYARSALSQGIVHFGVGNFHRAHLAVYLDELFNMGLNHDWAIIGAGVMPSDEVMYEKLKSQDFLTTIVEQDANYSAARVTGPMIDFIPPSQRQRLMATLADPAIRIVSLTVTEGGYMINPATGKFDPNHPALQRDAQNPDDPTSVFGLILHGLKSRKAMGLAPYTVMSCDNVPHNGVVTRNAVAGLARLMDPKLAEWIEASVAFPNAMVDRITPATSDRERKIASDMFGIEDNWPVFCEEFKQWVVEDHFPQGRPEFEKVGAQFVSDVTPFEYMKIRILNGGHAVIAYPGGLLDVHYVHEAMEHPLIHGFFAKVEQEEIIPTVLPVPNTNLQDYYKLIDRRFSNPKIGDTERRLCLDGSNRQPKFIVPVIADNLKAGRSIKGLALESALWCRYCFGTTESGKVIEPNDPVWDRLQALSRKAKDDPLEWLSMADIYGDVAEEPAFREAFAAALTALWTKGTAAVLEDYIAGR